MGHIEVNGKVPKRIGVLGGTFDPIHYGHLVMGEWAREKFLLDRVLFIPVGNPPHKGDVLDGKHRYMMTILATLDQPYFQVSPMEMEQKGTSYTVDTIKRLKSVYGDECQLYFITGADSILELYTWKNYEELLQSCYFIAATREGYDEKAFCDRIEEIHRIYGERIFKMDIPGLDISSTSLRKRMEEGKSVKYLLPLSVEKYIMKNNLYRS